MNNIAQRLTATFAFILLSSTAFSSTELRSTEECSFHGAREVSAASLHIADSASFDNYHYVWVDQIRFHDKTRSLKSSDQRHLRKLIKHSIEQQWQERLGWRSAATPGQAVASLSVDVEAPDGELEEVRVHARLRDSLTGRELMTQCGRELPLMLTDHAEHPQLAWNAVQQQVSHWGAGLGTHIMTVY
ncbi:hypothetical protein FHR99_000210 [Litorivivens lipolytica]|uniref:Uncharacterized protein n=1 Tax=Litorivivens lipolytica TaxID=1524264 RepID=A0A7W4W310_9GAMM|nr:hypothetical protein [Litorivivens lipolytica]MBB3045974.1 hypothetical protein [Litorivivens lipolytica]